MLTGNAWVSDLENATQFCIRCQCFTPTHITALKEYFTRKDTKWGAVSRLACMCPKITCSLSAMMMLGSSFQNSSQCFQCHTKQKAKLGAQQIDWNAGRYLRLLIRRSLLTFWNGLKCWSPLAVTRTELQQHKRKHRLFRSPNLRHWVLYCSRANVTGSGLRNSLGTTPYAENTSRWESA